MKEKDTETNPTLKKKLNSLYVEEKSCLSATSIVQAVLSYEGSKRGSIKPKIDLDDLIQEFKLIHNNPPWNDDTKSNLIIYLKNQMGLGIIDDVDDESISWINSKGNVKTAKISGLKNRYYK